MSWAAIPSWDDFGKWLRWVGSGLGKDLIQDPSDDPCAPRPTMGSVTYSGSCNVTATNYTAGEDHGDVRREDRAGMFVAA